VNFRKRKAWAKRIRNRRRRGLPTPEADAAVLRSRDAKKGISGALSAMGVAERKEYPAVSVIPKPLPTAKIVQGGLPGLGKKKP
jgi:hypothetical protein